MYLCRDTGAKANGDDLCPVHQTDDCVGHFVETDPEWHALNTRASNAEQAAQIAQRYLRKAGHLIDDATRAIQEPRQSIMGTNPPLMPKLDDLIVDKMIRRKESE